MRNKPIQITREKSTVKIEPVETGEEIRLSNKETALLESVAGILEYPSKDWISRLEGFGRLCHTIDLSESDGFSRFAESTAERNLFDSQELYTKTFDLNPVCALEIGYHLFGEDYKRGAFLANLRETENPFELGQEKQLPDYLPVVLRLLCRMDNDELRASLVGCCLLPALDKMTAQLRKKQNPYEGVFSGLEALLLKIAQDSLPLRTEAASVRLQHV